MTHPLSENVPMLSRELEDSAGRICVWHACICYCFIGSSAVADVMAIYPKARATILMDGPVRVGCHQGC